MVSERPVGNPAQLPYVTRASDAGQDGAGSGWAGLFPSVLQDPLNGPLALRVEHIGSTAVPGIGPSRSSDLQGSVEDLGVATLAFELPLTRLGCDEKLMGSQFAFAHGVLWRAYSPA
ncbi:hypothetical protein ABZ454_35185 [Streptomyces sp. NPDC005803]|uniref:hypothetical protein n=1 Tax=Streptomyces sp. NPDC005803 TaxID=3154297 RepID=UPI0033FC380E